MASEQTRTMLEQGKFPTVGQVMRGGGPPMNAKKARNQMERAAVTWSKRFAEDPTLIEAFRRDYGCGPSTGD